MARQQFKRLSVGDQPGVSGIQPIGCFGNVTLLWVKGSASGNSKIYNIHVSQVNKCIM
jgi:hypothetical protein